MNNPLILSGVISFIVSLVVAWAITEYMGKPRWLKG